MLLRHRVRRGQHVLHELPNHKLQCRRVDTADHVQPLALGVVVINGNGMRLNRQILALVLQQLLLMHDLGLERGNLRVSLLE